MSSSIMEGSKRRPCRAGPWNMDNPMRPGKTAEDKRIGSWASKTERNARQAQRREEADRKKS